MTTGGAGGAAEGKISSAVNASYNIIVGGGGGVNSYNGGYVECVPGGGACASSNNVNNQYGSGGGGYSGIFATNVISQSTALLIAGGGGGGGSSRAGTGNVGGAGGGAVGQDGVSAYDGKTYYAGRGGSQTAAGVDSSCDGANVSGSQGLFQGGRPRLNGYGGAGGGGYYGGSAGGYSEANTMAGGGGGSSYYNPGYVSNPVLTGGNYTTPGNSGSAYRGTAGNAGAVAAAGSSGVVVITYLSSTITASGGAIIYTDSSNANPRSGSPYLGGYTTHTFTSNGRFIIGPSVSVLVVGGGGGGGGSTGGGGGGGGVIYTATQLASPSNVYDVIVGAGGRVSGNKAWGKTGDASSFNGIFAYGGGGGGYSADGSSGGTGLGGGSGGGGQNYWGTYVSGGGTPGQGYRGGYFGTAAGSGGGGAGGPGGSGSGSNIGGPGGIGLAYSISGFSTYYGGGGGGGNGGVGGLGGGGNGADVGAGGAANTGGGGGGGWSYASGNGGAGGSGIVIISYPTGSMTAVGGIMTTSGGNTIHTFTGSGTFIVGSASGTLVTNGLVLNLDAGNPASYPGSGTNWADLSGNSLNGTLVNGVGYNSANGGALTFNGTNNYVNIPNNVKLQVTGNQTIDFWSKSTNITAGRQNIIDKAYGGEFGFTQETDGGINYYYGTLGAQGSPYQGFGTAPSVFIQGQWQHMTIVRNFSNSMLYWYRNGALIGSTPTSYTYSAASTYAVTIGIGYTGVYYSGYIGSIHLYNRALSGSEVLQNFNTFRSRYGI